MCFRLLKTERRGRAAVPRTRCRTRRCRIFRPSTLTLVSTAAALPALDVELAHDLMEQTRIFKLLKGSRAQPPTNLDAVADTLVRLSQLVIDCPAVREL